MAIMYSSGFTLGGDPFQSQNVRECEHCHGDINIRNPMGFCDHLYYPEFCRTCQKLQKEKELKNE